MKDDNKRESWRKLITLLRINLKKKLIKLKFNIRLKKKSSNIKNSRTKKP
jgi:hypothetical protein